MKVHKIRWQVPDYWQKVNAVLAMLLGPQQTNKEKNCHACDFPLWNVLLWWMSACPLWLIMLPFTRESQCPIAAQRRARVVIWRAGWSVTSEDYRWIFGSVGVSLHHYCLHFFFCIRKICICSFSWLPPCVPCSRHVFIQDPPAEIRHAKPCMENLSKDLPLPRLERADCRTPLNFCVTN